MDCFRFCSVWFSIYRFCFEHFYTKKIFFLFKNKNDWTRKSKPGHGEARYGKTGPLWGQVELRPGSGRPRQGRVWAWWEKSRIM